MAGSAEQQQPNVPIVEVAFSYGKWWSIPQEMSAQLYDKYVNGQDAGYTWDWGEGGRAGSWKPDGEETTINRYVIDFATGVQTNLDNQRKRSIRLIWVPPQDVINWQRPLAEQRCLAGDSFLAMVLQSTCQARRIAIFLCMCSCHGNKNIRVYANAWTILRNSLNSV